ncbi:hypothetical protein GCM10009850_106710 [Nonomuraea monospora]|uniref:Uncharacterized protein n=1 Tax=Nonomuraea monospora TaxID=568818 RepID=A0ABP5PU61_9ACTN
MPEARPADRKACTAHGARASRTPAAQHPEAADARDGAASRQDRARPEGEARTTPRTDPQAQEGAPHGRAAPGEAAPRPARPPDRPNAEPAPAQAAEPDSAAAVAGEPHPNRNPNRNSNPNRSPNPNPNRNRSPNQNQIQNRTVTVTVAGSLRAADRCEARTSHARRCHSYPAHFFTE